jgi:hypothetical protein
LLACFLCSILSGDLLVEPGEFSLHRVQPGIASHQLVYVQSTSDASVEIPVAKERRREAYNKQAGSLNMRMSLKKEPKNNERNMPVPRESSVNLTIRSVGAV